MRVLGLALVVMLSGCTALDRVNDALVSTGCFDLAPSTASSSVEHGVAITTGHGRGRGAITGLRTVLTVEHVVGASSEVEVATSSFGWTRARVVRKIAAAPESIVELELDGEAFDASRVAEPGEGTAAWIVAARGPIAWGAAVRQGDSGSPVMDSTGRLVGLIVGYAKGGAPVAAWLPAPSANVQELARR